MCRVLLHEFGVVQAHRTSSNLLEPPHCRYRAKCVEFCNMGSGWFDCTEPPLSIYLEEKQGVQGAFALVRGSSSALTWVRGGSTVPNLLYLHI